VVGAQSYGCRKYLSATEINELESLLDCAWFLYLEKGGAGIGQKRIAQFSVWAVATVD